MASISNKSDSDSVDVTGIAARIHLRREERCLEDPFSELAECGQLIELSCFDDAYSIISDCWQIKYVCRSSFCELFQDLHQFQEHMNKF